MTNTDQNNQNDQNAIVTPVKDNKSNKRVSEDHETFKSTQPIPIHDLSRKHPLWCRWSLWYDGPAKKTTLKNWSDNLKEVAQFDTVEDFWGVYNNIQSSSLLPAGSNYHLFKHGIKPMWEHEANRRGGKWIVAFPSKYKGRLDTMWLNLSLALVGEHFSEGDEVCGGVVSTRKQNSRISIWTRSAKEKDLCLSIGRQFRSFLSLEDHADVKFFYQSHGDALQNDSSYGNKPLYVLD